MNWILGVRRRSLVAVMLLMLPAFSGCSKSDSAPGRPGTVDFDDSIDRFKTGMVSGRLQRSDLDPASASAPLTIVTPLGRAAVAADGAYSLPGFVNSPTPALILDATNNLRSFAFIEPSGTVIDNALVARSLAMIASKGEFLLPALRATYWKNLGSAPEVVALAEGLRGMGGHLAGAPAATQMLVTTHIGALVKRLRTAPPALRITPPDAKSGVEVLQQGLNEMVVVNHHRRRAQAFVERVGVTLADDTQQPRQDAITNFPIAPVTLPASLSAALADAGTVLGNGNSAFAGNVAYVDTSSMPLALELTPADAKMTTYRAVVVGPGVKRGMVANLTPEMELALTNKWGETIGLDVLLPVFMNLVGPMLDKGAPNGQSPAEREQAVNLIKDLASQLYTLPAVQSQIDAGDIPGAIATCLNAVLSTDAFASLRADIIRKLILSYAPNADLDFVNQFLGGLKKLLIYVDVALQSLDSIAVAQGIVTATCFEEFLIDVIKTRVTLTPASAKLSVLSSQMFQARVPDATGAEAPLVTYRFKVTSGTGLVQLKNPANGMIAEELGSSSGAMIAESANHMVGTANLEVEAVMIPNGTQTQVSLGKAYATIRVINDKAVIMPAKSSIKPKATVRLLAKVNNPQPGSLYRFVWSGTNKLGSIDRGMEMTVVNAAVYTSSGPTGSDQVTVTLYQQGESGVIRIGQATATVLIEEEPTILPASYRAVVVGTSAYGVVSFTKPAGFNSFRLVGEGGYDPAYYAEKISLGGMPLQLIDGVFDLGAGNLGWALSSGSSANPAEFIPWLDARFGGFSFYVQASR